MLQFHNSKRSRSSGIWHRNRELEPKYKHAVILSNCQCCEVPTCIGSLLRDRMSQQRTLRGKYKISRESLKDEGNAVVVSCFY